MPPNKIYPAPVISTPDPEPQRERENAYYNKEGEDKNFHPVVYQASVQSSSIGWTQQNFFHELGDKRLKAWNWLWNKKVMTSEQLVGIANSQGQLRAEAFEGLQKRAEQEYLLANMVKGAMWAAVEIARITKTAIAVRGTGLPAHMGIEIGAPTKAQEFKNKTSKLEDVVLCEYIKFEDVGAVVHYDPRPAWTPLTAATFADIWKTPANEGDWNTGKPLIMQRLQKLRERLTLATPQMQLRHNLQGPVAPATLGMYQLPTEASLKSTFLSRSKEYHEEDEAYRTGRFALHTTLDGPYVRLKLRPNDNMVGDHDLFAFMDENATVIIPRPDDVRIRAAQELLQKSSEFQAQHGGIWYWAPGTNFNQGIKDKIMGAHGPEGKEPLVLIQKDQIRAAYFCGEDKIKSVWDFEKGKATGWLETTHSGKLLKTLLQG